MGKNAKTEVHLEVSSGFFRIPTESVNYNISVLNGAAGTPQVPEDTGVPQYTPPEVVEPVNDDYYMRAMDTLRERLGPLAARAATLETELLPKVRETLERAVELQGDIDGLQNTLEQAKPVAESAESGNSQDLGEVHRKLLALRGLLESSPPAETQSAGESNPPKQRYLFDIDVVFQTMYELCTNETVKTHTQDARAKADTLFERDKFLDIISERVAGYSEDDGFLSVPIADVLTALSASCSDKAIINLFKNMNKKQADIFLDQFLPLEVPPTEEVAAAVEAEPEAAGGGVDMAALSAQIDEIVNEIAAMRDAQGEAPTPSASTGVPSEALAEIAALDSKVKGVAQSLEYTLNALLEDPSMKPLAGECGLFGGVIALNRKVSEMLQLKEENPSLSSPQEEMDSPEVDSVAIQGKDSDMTLEAEPSVSEEDFDGGDPVEDVEEAGEAERAEEVLEAEALAAGEEDIEEFGEGEEDDDDFGEASQDDIDKLLEDMS